jgi:hypothetical protein
VTFKVQLRVKSGRFFKLPDNGYIVFRLEALMSLKLVKMTCVDAKGSQGMLRSILQVTADVSCLVSFHTILTPPNGILTSKMSIVNPKLLLNLILKKMQFVDFQEITKIFT